MFAFFNRSRRHVAVLTALAMVASVLVAAPAVAADDPEPSLEATFTACVGIESSGFTDVPAAHSNAGDIDCIAYYGITEGTGGNNYSPSMAVTREHMALFLTRLAARVGIEMVSDPGDPGFTDIGDLSAKSQTAIAQIADLEITSGTGDGTTYSPAAHVERGHMALFLFRLMNLMTPYGGADSDDAHTPSDVDDEDSDDIGSPYTDIRSVTVRTNDAITALYELGVASGISATAYAPTASITRAAMAEFMVGVMAHSNLRPAGASIQAAKTSGFGDITTTVIISVRDDSFAAVVDQPVDHFNSNADDGGLDDGACSDVDDAVNGDCEWTEDDDFTNGDGNLVLPGESTMEGKTRVYYAWIGDEAGDKFDADDADYHSVSITASKDEEALKATSTINEEAATDSGNRVDLDKVSTVTITVQLVDTDNGETGEAAGPDDDAKAVARSGQDITVAVTRSTDANSDGDSGDSGEGQAYSSTNVATLTTDDDGRVTYTVEGPDDDNDNNDVNFGDVTNDTVDPPTTAMVADIAGLEDRIDTITFNYVTDDNDGTPAVEEVVYTIRWSEANPMTTKVEATANDYVIVESDGDARVSSTVTFYDQYGNGYRQGTGQKVGIEFGAGEMRTGTNGEPEAYNPVANVGGNGVARRSKTLEGQSAGTPIAVVYIEDAPAENDAVDLPDVDMDLDDAPSIQVVSEADTDDTDAGPKMVHTLYADDNKFTTQAVDGGILQDDADTLYSYDSDDTFIMDGETITMDEFEKALANQPDVAGEAVPNAAVVNVVIYNPDGLSIFEVTAASDST